mmetsp:Transcript_16578/g.29018  ORF Transcript_16578/g.29018 Transcript_16578/m.29018 type:complete len:204 (-) Transcript_16578:213-824(-)
MLMMTVMIMLIMVHIAVHILHVTILFVTRQVNESVDAIAAALKKDLLQLLPPLQPLESSSLVGLLVCVALSTLRADALAMHAGPSRPWLGGSLPVPSVHLKALFANDLSAHAKDGVEAGDGADGFQRPSTHVAESRRGGVRVPSDLGLACKLLELLHQSRILLLQRLCGGNHLLGWFLSRRPWLLDSPPNDARRHGFGRRKHG